MNGIGLLGNFEKSWENSEVGKVKLNSSMKSTHNLGVKITDHYIYELKTGLFYKKHCHSCELEEIFKGNIQPFSCRLTISGSVRY